MKWRGPESICVQRTSDEHDNDREDFLPHGVGRHITESYRGERRAGVIQGCHVGLGVRHTTAVG